MKIYKHLFIFFLLAILIASCRSSPDITELAEAADTFVEDSNLPDIILPPVMHFSDVQEAPILPLPSFTTPYTPPEQIVMLPEPIPPEPIVPEPVEPPLPPPLQEELPLEMQEVEPVLPETEIEAELPEPEPEPELEPELEPEPGPEPEPVVPPIEVPPPPPVHIAPAEPPFIPPVIPEPLVMDPFPVPANPAPEPLTEEINFSRIVRATVGQIVEIPFRGTGWVFLGELANRRGIRYEARRLDVQDTVTEGQSFIFLCETAGTYILRFYRQDFIQDYIVNDYVQVIVGESAAVTANQPGMERSRIIAEPRWPPLAGLPAPTPTPAPIPMPATDPVSALPLTPLLPEQETEYDLEQELEPEIVQDELLPSLLVEAEYAQITPLFPDLPLMLSMHEYIQRARQEMDAGRVREAINVLDTMKQFYPQGSDEAWWLYGQLLEANSPSRDIRMALEYYNSLIREYPLSSRVTDAQRRIAYIERFFLNIR